MPAGFPILPGRSSLIDQRKPRLAVPPAERILQPEVKLFLCSSLSGVFKESMALVRKRLQDRRIEREQSQISMSPSSTGLLGLCPDQSSYPTDVDLDLWSLYNQ